MASMTGWFVVDFRVHGDAMVWPMVAAGTSNDEMKYARRYWCPSRTEDSDTNFNALLSVLVEDNSVWLIAGPSCGFNIGSLADEHGCRCRG